MTPTPTSTSHMSPTRPSGRPPKTSALTSITNPPINTGNPSPHTAVSTVSKPTERSAVRTAPPPPGNDLHREQRANSAAPVRPPPQIPATGSPVRLPWPPSPHGEEEQQREQVERQRGRRRTDGHQQDTGRGDAARTCRAAAARSQVRRRHRYDLQGLEDGDVPGRQGAGRRPQCVARGHRRLRFRPVGDVRRADPDAQPRPAGEDAASATPVTTPRPSAPRRARRC